MARIDNYNFARQPNEVILFKEAVENIINFGKYQFQVVTIAPTYAGSNGEMVIYRSGTDGRLYVYLGSSWNVALLFTADAS